MVGSVGFLFLWILQLNMVYCFISRNIRLMNNEKLKHWPSMKENSINQLTSNYRSNLMPSHDKRLNRLYIAPFKSNDSSEFFTTYIHSYIHTPFTHIHTPMVQHLIDVGFSVLPKDTSKRCLQGWELNHWSSDQKSNQWTYEQTPCIKCKENWAPKFSWKLEKPHLLWIYIKF